MDPKKGGWGKREGKKSDVCIHIADSLCCTVETDIIVLGNYTSIKKIEKDEKKDNAISL